jgi:SAM-dependent methyltransferase
MYKDENAIWIKQKTTFTGINYPDEGSDDSFAIQQNSFWYEHRNSLLLALIKKYPFSGAFADIGGGNGYQVYQFSENMKEKEFYLVEPSYAACRNARSKSLEHVYCMQFQDFPFQEKNIGGIGLFDVIEHIEDDAAFLNSLKTKLIKRSRIYITVPAHQFLWSDVDDYAMHFRRYNKKMFTELAEDCQASMLYFSYFFSFLLIPSWLLRAVPYRIGIRRSGETIIKTEKKQHSQSNISRKWIEKLCKNELKKFSKGKISCGASCLAVFET